MIGAATIQRLRGDHQFAIETATEALTGMAMKLMGRK